MQDIYYSSLEIVYYVTYSDIVFLSDTIDFKCNGYDVYQYVPIPLRNNSPNYIEFKISQTKKYKIHINNGVNIISRLSLSKNGKLFFNGAPTTKGGPDFLFFLDDDGYWHDSFFECTNKKDNTECRAYLKITGKCYTMKIYLPATPTEFKNLFRPYTS